MPVLPASYYSNYYLVSINLSSGLNLNTALNTSFPVLSGTFLASKFSVKIENKTTNKLMIQGKPGYAVKDSNALIYTYEIEFPIIIGPGGISNDYIVLHTFIMNAINNQYQALWQSNNTNYNHAFIENYKMNFQENQSSFSVVIISDTKLNLDAKLFDNTIIKNNTYGRLMRNYDVYAALAVTDFKTNETYNLGPADNIFIRQADFSVKFDYETKFFLNQSLLDSLSINQNPIFFLLKNYDVTQNLSIVGIENNLFPAFFQPGDYDVYDFNSTIYFASSGLWWLHFNLPGYVAATTLNVSADNVVETKFDFSLYGVPSYIDTNDTLISTNL